MPDLEDGAAFLTFAAAAASRRTRFREGEIASSGLTGEGEAALSDGMSISIGAAAMRARKLAAGPLTVDRSDWPPTIERHTCNKNHTKCI